MRFAAAALLVAGVAVADYTTYVTDVVTITSCAPTVTNCPAHSIVTSMTSYPVVVPETSTMYSTAESTIHCKPVPLSIARCQNG